MVLALEISGPQYNVTTGTVTLNASVLESDLEELGPLGSYAGRAARWVGGQAFVAAKLLRRGCWRRAVHGSGKEREKGRCAGWPVRFSCDPGAGWAACACSSARWGCSGCQRAQCCCACPAAEGRG